MKRVFCLATFIASVHVSAETILWELKQDPVLNGQIDVANSTNRQIEFNVLSNQFISVLDTTQPLDFLKGQVEQRNNQASGAGSIERISFRIVEDSAMT